MGHKGGKFWATKNIVFSMRHPRERQQSPPKGPTGGFTVTNCDSFLLYTAAGGRLSAAAHCTSCSLISRLLPNGFALIKSHSGVRVRAGFRPAVMPRAKWTPEPNHCQPALFEWHACHVLEPCTSAISAMGTAAVCPMSPGDWLVLCALYTWVCFMSHFAWA